MYWSAGMKIADFDGGTGAGAPDVDAAIGGGTLSPLGLTITVLLLLNLKNAFGGKAPATHLDRSVSSLGGFGIAPRQGDGAVGSMCVGQ
jgi:hypothetical protein